MEETCRLPHRRRGLRGLRARRSAERGRLASRAAARVRRLRPLHFHSNAVGVVDSHEHAEIQLVLSHGTRAAFERPAHAHAARQGAGGLLLHQRTGVHPRQCAGLRALGGGGCGGLVLPRRAALFQARREARGGRRRLPRQQREAAHELRARDQPLACRMARGRGRGGLSAIVRRQWVSTGRFRPHGHDRCGRHALQRRARLFASRACAGRISRW